MYDTLIGTDIEVAKYWLDHLEVIGIPTETVYGLAGNALNEDAVLKIFKAKERPRFNPLIIHLKSWEDVLHYTTEVPAIAHRLAAVFCPGPLTMLLPKSGIIPDLVTAGSVKVAVRVPSHPLTRNLLGLLPYPLAAPSANRFGYVSPVTAGHVYEGLHGRIPYILDGGACTVGLESTIIDFENEGIIVRRLGGITIEQLEEAKGSKIKMQVGATQHPVAPGQLKSH